MERAIEDRAATVARLQKLPPVVLATPLVDGQAMTVFGQAVRGVVLRGMPTDALKRLPALAGNVRAVHWIHCRKAGGGHWPALAERYGIGVGDPVTLIAPRGTVTPFGTTPRIKQFRVAAIFSIGLSEYDLNIMFSGLETAQGFFSESAQSGAIELTLDDPDKVEAYRGICRTPPDLTFLWSIGNSPIVRWPEHWRLSAMSCSSF